MCWAERFSAKLNPKAWTEIPRLLYYILNTEVKIFFSIWNKRLILFLENNNYIDTSVNKGVCPRHSRMNGEHRSHNYWKKQKQIRVIWQFYSWTSKMFFWFLPHKLEEVTPKCYHVIDRISDLILDYSKTFKIRTISKGSISVWHNLKRGIITGCTISATLFTLAMNLLIKTEELECRGPVPRFGRRQLLIWAYMDDMTITTTSTIGARWVLKGIEKLVTWARRSLHASKPWSLLLKGIALERGRFKLSGKIIPAIQEKSIKSLGKHIDHSLRDTVTIQETKVNLEKWLTKVDKSGLPSRFKAKIYRRAILPKILWPLPMNLQ